MRNTLTKIFPGFTFLALAGLLTVGCETVTFEGESGPAPSDTATGLASLRFVNQRETDAGPIALHLFAASAHTIDDARPARSFAKVNFGKEATFQVPAGRWKIGYATDGGVLRHMPAAEGEGLTDDWPTVTMTKGDSYILALKTVENNTVWFHNLTID